MKLVTDEIYDLKIKYRDCYEVISTSIVDNDFCENIYRVFYFANTFESMGIVEINL